MGLISTMASNGAQFTRERNLSDIFFVSKLIHFFRPTADIDFSPAAQQYLNFYGCIAAGKPGKSVAPTIILFVPFLRVLSDPS
jgi:hypothetical protein